jgi:hypothetical protein
LRCGIAHGSLGGFLFGRSFGFFVGSLGGFLFGRSFGFFVGSLGGFLFGRSFGFFVGSLGSEVLSELSQSVQQSPGIATEATILDNGSIPVAQFLQWSGKFRQCWHGRPTDQNRNYSYISCQGREHLLPVSVALVVEPPVARLVTNADPIWPDYNNYNITCTHSSGDRLAEVISRCNRVDVYEHACGSPFADQVLMQASSPTR